MGAPGKGVSPTLVQVKQSVVVNLGVYYVHAQLADLRPPGNC